MTRNRVLCPMARWYNRSMSRLNGDKSRHQINRKRVVLRRAKIKKLVDEVQARKAAGAQEPEKRPSK